MENYLAGLEDLQDDGDQYWTTHSSNDFTFLPQVPWKEFDTSLGSTPTIKMSSQFGPAMHITLPRWYAICRHALEKGWTDDPDDMISKYEEGQVSDRDLWAYVKDNFCDMGALRVEIVKMYRAYLIARLNEPKSKEIKLTDCDRTVTVDRGSYPTLAQFDWYEYYDPYLKRTFAACDTPSGRRVLMENVIFRVDTLDDDECDDFGGVVEGNDQDFLPDISIKTYRMQLMCCQDPVVLQVSSDFGPKAHFVLPPEFTEYYANNGVIDEDACDKIRGSAVEMYQRFLTDLSYCKEIQKRS